MTTKPDLTITSEEFISLNAEASVTVGNAMQIQLKTVHPVVIFEGDTKPADEATDGTVMTNLHYNYAVVIIPEGSSEVWARALQKDTSSILNIQEV